MRGPPLNQGDSAVVQETFDDLTMEPWKGNAVGRTLLVYQTSDGETTGWFNPSNRQYELLDDKYRLEVKKGLSIARNEKAPDLVTLPVPGPEVAQ